MPFVLCYACVYLLEDFGIPSHLFYSFWGEEKKKAISPPSLHLGSPLHAEISFDKNVVKERKILLLLRKS